MAVAALARLTASDLLRQGSTWLVVSIGVVLLALSLVFGMFNFDEGDRMRMLVSAGITVQVLAGLFLAVVGATAAVHQELADRTAHVLFAKPVGRGQFLAGKAIGVLGAIALVSAILVAAHVAVVLLGSATGFEFDHGGHHHHHDEDPVPIPWGPLLAGHGLGLAQAACLACLATALAVRLGLAANILVCFAVWVVAHLLPWLGLHGLFAIPALDLLTIDDATRLAGRDWSWPAAGGALLHALLFCPGALLLGLALLESRDIP